VDDLDQRSAGAALSERAHHPVDGDLDRDAIRTGARFAVRITDRITVRSHIREDRGRTFVIEGGIHLAETGEELTRARGTFFVSPEVTAAARDHEQNHEEGR